jgi:ubiquinone/menaquinone biosynthesis C-methylase UbiE
MSSDEKKIKDFWERNPVGEQFVSSKDQRDFFLMYDEFRYSTEEHILRELDSINFNGKKVLEVGVGQAADASRIIDRGGIYYGLDLTEESVQRAKSRFQLFNKTYAQLKTGSALSINYPSNHFDIIYSHGVIHHSPQINEIIEEFYRVLKPGGEIIAMLYHKNSFNYYVSINIARRIGLLFIWLVPPLSGLAGLLTGETKDRILKHVENLKSEGLSYLKMTNFIHKSTDGPENVYSSVWTKKDVFKLFSKFKVTKTTVHFLNQRHLMGLQFIIPTKLKRKIEAKWGWHLWVKVKKE